MMAQNTLSKMIDFSNRSLFEGLMDYFIHPVETVKRAFAFYSDWYSKDENFYYKHLLGYYDALYFHLRHKYIRPLLKNNGYYLTDQREWFPTLPNLLIKTISGLGMLVHSLISVIIDLLALRYVTDFAFRVALLPLTSTVYCVSRLKAVVFNPDATQHNPNKTRLMRVATVISALGIIPLAILVQPAQIASLFGMSSGLAGGLILGFASSLLLSTLLFTAKKIAQHMNAHVFQTQNIILPAPFVRGGSNFRVIDENTTEYTITAPKHYVEGGLVELRSLNGDKYEGIKEYQSSLQKYFAYKQLAIYGNPINFEGSDAYKNIAILKQDEFKSGLEENTKSLRNTLK